MEERQVSVDGTTHALPSPYFVVATENPSDQIGTFPLPESQLDRFLMRVELGYSNEASERELLVVRYRPPPKDDAARLYEKFTAATGITPNLGETPLAYSGRLGAKAASGAATKITQLYLQTHYGATDIGDVSALRAAVNEYSRAARA